MLNNLSNTSIKYIKIFEERNSGTNYLSELIEKI